MPNKEEIFHLSGPVHLLTTLDWKNPSHRRSVAATLVSGVYVMESDRNKNREGSRALAPPWWQTFHFARYQYLTDNTHSSIFGGAIFQLLTHTEAAPRCVVAFRGTKLFGESSFRDLKLGARIIRNRLHQTSCFETAIKAVRDAIDTFGSSNVWIAGHSLGAAVALLAGKEMAKGGVFINDTFLFNSPFPSLPIDRAIWSRKKRFAFRVATSVVKAGVALFLQVEDEAFAALDTWRPHLFVNREDLICSGYIGYFEHRKKMEAMGGEEMGKKAAQHSLVGLLLHALGKEWREPMHLIPSAHLTVYGKPSKCKDAHRLRQWWEADDRHMETKTYTFTSVVDDDDDDVVVDDHDDDDDESNPHAAE